MWKRRKRKQLDVCFQRTWSALREEKLGYSEERVPFACLPLIRILNFSIDFVITLKQRNLSSASRTAKAKGNGAQETEREKIVENYRLERRWEI